MTTFNIHAWTYKFLQVKNIIPQFHVSFIKKEQNVLKDDEITTSKYRNNLYSIPE
jgi:hypothetical protein